MGLDAIPQKRIIAKKGGEGSECGSLRNTREEERWRESETEKDWLVR